jgi:(p)ppGpp synthase/HD superfamily hydrolase
MTVVLGRRYADAVAYAAHLHRDQVRKGSAVPYVSHLLGASGLVLEAGGSEEEAIAALLHDALEDQGHRTSYEEIAERFSPEIARIVRACSDTELEPKPPWQARKDAYLAHLEQADPSVLRVSRADKLHNARSVVTDLRAMGPELWDRFSSGRDGLIWYYGALADVFAARLPGPQSDELLDTVRRMGEMAAERA